MPIGDASEVPVGTHGQMIVGLGNPGSRYRDSRHNLGFRVIEELARREKLQMNRLECNALVGESGDKVLVMPQTYMNRSGFAVRCLAERRRIAPGDILVVFDDVNLELGRLRLRTRGGPGGHRGMESVIQNLRTDEVPRLRLGIGGSTGSESDSDLVDFVLSPFAREERETIAELIRRAATACESWLRVGAEPTMSRFNC